MTFDFPLHGIRLKSNLKNPLGIMKSTDQGNTLEKIKFYGEIDFHYLAASYYNHTLYVYNEHPNSLTVGNVKMMAACIRLDRECADICSFT